jgi:hypothetical protein
MPESTDSGEDLRKYWKGAGLVSLLGLIVTLFVAILPQLRHPDTQTNVNPGSPPTTTISPLGGSRHSSIHHHRACRNTAASMYSRKMVIQGWATAFYIVVI